MLRANTVEDIALLPLSLSLFLGVRQLNSKSYQNKDMVQVLQQHALRQTIMVMSLTISFDQKIMNGVYYAERPLSFQECRALESSLDGFQSVVD